MITFPRRSTKVERDSQGFTFFINILGKVELLLIIIDRMQFYVIQMSKSSSMGGKIALYRTKDAVEIEFHRFLSSYTYK